MNARKEKLSDCYNSSMSARKMYANTNAHNVNSKASLNSPLINHRIA